MDDFTNATTLGITVVGLLTGLGLVVISGIWVYRDAKANRIPIDSKPYSTNNGAWAWFGYLSVFSSKSCIYALLENKIGSYPYH